MTIAAVAEHRSDRMVVTEHVRETLSQKWIKTEYGWALPDDPDENINGFGDFDEWRDAFEDEQQSKEDSAEGVGRFGI